MPPGGIPGQFNPTVGGPSAPAYWAASLGGFTLPDDAHEILQACEARAGEHSTADVAELPLREKPIRREVSEPARGQSKPEESPRRAKPMCDEIRGQRATKAPAWKTYFGMAEGSETLSTRIKRPTKLV